MRATSIDQVRSELERLRRREADLIEERKREIGAMAERAGALELCDDVIVGALLTAVEDAVAAARFQEWGRGRGSARRQRRSASRRAAASRAPARDAGQSGMAGA